MAVKKQLAGIARGFLWVSDEQTGTGAAQNIAHPMGRAPDIVLVVPTGSPGTYAALTVTEGTHTASNIVVAVTSGWKYKVIGFWLR